MRRLLWHSAVLKLIPRRAAIPFVVQPSQISIKTSCSRVVIFCVPRLDVFLKPCRLRCMRRYIHKLKKRASPHILCLLTCVGGTEVTTKPEDTEQCHHTQSDK